mmetsp:Transcript_55080/g.145411  ORF Transcript_55080/g.145411 Transcript_55080/m.145411 type:complete len:143 (+) Transcript_55080:172-600(+)
MLPEALHDYDRMRTGFVSPQIFTRVLCSLGFEQLGESLDLLAALYQSPDHRDKLVDYKAFCTEMNYPATSERAILQDLFDRLRREFKERGAAGLHGMLRAFSMHDRAGFGRVEISQLTPALTVCGVSLSRCGRAIRFDSWRR